MRRWQLNDRNGEGFSTRADTGPAATVTPRSASKNLHHCCLWIFGTHQWRATVVDV